jgi:hypothetical protein
MGVEIPPDVAASQKNISINWFLKKFQYQWIAKKKSVIIDYQKKSR